MTKSGEELTWQELEVGSIITEPGNAVEYQTGDWRTQRPTYNHQRCIKCGLCYILCPEGCIKATKEGYFEADLFYCKGCGICAQECWPKAITMVEEG